MGGRGREREGEREGGREGGREREGERERGRERERASCSRLLHGHRSWLIIARRRRHHTTAVRNRSLRCACMSESWRGRGSGRERERARREERARGRERTRTGRRGAAHRGRLRSQALYGARIIVSVKILQATPPAAAAANPLWEEYRNRPFGRHTLSLSLSLPRSLLSLFLSRSLSRSGHLLGPPAGRADQ